jgi:hypothetical protein
LPLLDLNFSVEVSSEINIIKNNGVACA